MRFLQAVSYVLNKAGGKLSSTEFAVRPAPGEGGGGRGVEAPGARLAEASSAGTHSEDVTG